jgi:hypothetical protein
MKLNFNVSKKVKPQAKSGKGKGKKAKAKVQRKDSDNTDKASGSRKQKSMQPSIQDSDAKFLKTDNKLSRSPQPDLLPQQEDIQNRDMSIEDDS